MNKQYVYFIIWLFVSCCTLFGQQTQTTSNMTVGTEIEPIKIVAHTDSSIFLLGKKTNEKGEWDFYITKYTAYKDKIEFNVCLNLAKVFKGGINPNSTNFEFMQQKNHIVLLFTAVNQQNKILLGKIIGYDGDVSEAFVLDKTDYTNDNLEKCEYDYYNTSKKNVLVHIEREYKSGFKRDKCILLDPFLNKIWEYELPQLNAKTEENIIVDVDNLNRLIYYPWKFVTVVSASMDVKRRYQSVFDDPNKFRYQRVYRGPNDTILPLKVDNLKYNMKFRKDSIKLIFVNPLKNDVLSQSFYYPFITSPIIKSITSSQLLMYGIVDIDDEGFQLMGKKAIYYKRLDFKCNQVLLDTLIVLDDKLQRKLMHSYTGNTHPTSKYFKLMSENIVDGKLVNIYEHNLNAQEYNPKAYPQKNKQFLEVLTTCYDITNNKFEWVYLLPRKINFYYPNLYDVVVRGYSGMVSVSFFEHRKNALKNNFNYDFSKYKLLRKPKDKRFVTYIISDSKNITKTLNNAIDNTFMFPWLSSKASNSHFFTTKDFHPNDYFLFKN